MSSVGPIGPVFPEHSRSPSPSNDQGGEVVAQNLGPAPRNAPSLRQVAGGTYMDSPRATAEQEAELNQLCAAIVGEGVQTYSISLTNMTITRDNVTAPLPNTQEVRRARQLVGEIYQTDPKKPPFAWEREWSEDSRGPKNGPLPFADWGFEKLPEIDPKALIEGLPNPIDRLKRYQTALSWVDRMHEDLTEREKSICQEKSSVQGPESSEKTKALQEYKNRLEGVGRAKKSLEGINRFFLGFASLHPTESTEEIYKKAHALLTAFEPTLTGTFSKLKEAFPGTKHKPNGDPEIAAKELSLANIEGRDHYLKECELRKAKPRKDGVELFILQLSRQIARNNEEIHLGAVSFQDTFGEALAPVDADWFKGVLGEEYKDLRSRFHENRIGESEDLSQLQQRIADLFEPAADDEVP